jgi:DNA-binding NarL/FixJ family response regulator
MNKHGWELKDSYAHDSEDVQNKINDINKKIEQLKYERIKLHAMKRNIHKHDICPDHKFNKALALKILDVFPGLTSPKEVEIVYYMLKGMENKKIGETIFRTVKCVKWHKTNIFRKTKLKSHAQVLAAFANSGATNADSL